MRRALLAFITALIVARPLVLGEDPGLLNRLSSATDLVLNVLWFVAAVAWAGWRAWYRQGTWTGSAVGLGLAGVVVVVFASVGAAHYRHPALLIACEWLILLLAFGLVRQLARTPADTCGLLAAVLATGASLSAQAVYQSAVQMRGHRELANDPTRLLEAGVKLFGPMQPDGARLEGLKKRLEMGYAYATYAHPNSFAGYLALLLPAAVGWVAAGRRAFGWGPRILLAAGCALLLGVGLWLTYSRGAILAVLLVGLTAAAVYGRRFWWTHRARVGAGLVLLVGVLLVLSRSERGAAALDKASSSFGLRTEYWRATWPMIRDHPWLGVGPGNFGRLYPRYMAATAYEKIQDPHNFALELWATSGVVALLALLVTLGFFFRRIGSVAASGLACGLESGDSPQARPLAATDPEPRIRWEFYLGGMAGLLLGFLLLAGDLAAEDLLPEGLLAGVRSMLWFAVFAVLEGIPWPSRSRALALTAGVAALLVNLTVSGGIAFPSVAQPLWVLAALALNSAEPQPVPQRPRSLLAWVLPLPLLAGVGIAYLLLVSVPATRCAASLAQARLHYGDIPQLPGWRNEVLPRWQQRMKEGTPREQAQATLNAGTYLREHILQPLETAARDDPGDSAPFIELAYWYQERWKLLPDAEAAYAKALDHARNAQRLDPDNKEGYLAAYQLHKLVAERYPVRAKEQYGLAATVFQAVVDRDPTEARLHYELAELLFLAGDPVKARLQAARARDLDQLATVPSRHLTGPQRARVDQWLAGGNVGQVSNLPEKAGKLETCPTLG